MDGMYGLDWLDKPSVGEMVLLFIFVWFVEFN